MECDGPGFYWPSQPYVVCPTPWDPYVVCPTPWDPVLLMVYPFHWHPYGCQAAHAYDQKANKKKRPTTHKEKKKQSDGKTLKQREEDAKGIVMSLAVDYATFTISQAMTMHQQQDRTPQERLALRVTIAEKMINAETHEERAMQFAFFKQQMECSLQHLDKGIKDDLRASFLKAAHHRMEPLKHAAADMQ